MSLSEELKRALGNPGIWAYVKEEYYNAAIAYLDKECNEFHDKSRGELKVKFKDFQYKQAIDACDFSHEKFQDEDVLIGIWRVDKAYLPAPEYTGEELVDYLTDIKYADLAIAKSNTLKDYEKFLNGKTCKSCKDNNEIVELSKEPIQHYDHDGGYEVDGFKEKQWLYVICPKCDYQWALHKLRIGEIKTKK